MLMEECKTSKKIEHTENTVWTMKQFYSKTHLFLHLASPEKYTQLFCLFSVKFSKEIISIHLNGTHSASIGPLVFTIY